MLPEEAWERFRKHRRGGAPPRALLPSGTGTDSYKEAPVQSEFVTVKQKNLPLQSRRSFWPKGVLDEFFESDSSLARTRRGEPPKKPLTNDSKVDFDR
jgi:hypothetical protein